MPTDRRFSPISSTSVALSVGAVAVGFTSPPAGATIAMGQVLENDVRYWVDGSTPTAIEGFLARKNGRIVLRGYAEISGFKAAAPGSTAKLQFGFWEGIPDPTDLALLTAGA